MKATWQGRMSQTVAKYGENAPMAAVCCNACRTCVQTNLIAAAFAAVLSLGAVIVGFGKRLVRAS